MFLAGLDCFDGTGGVSCCTSSNQCREGEGDCDSDDECLGNLKCGQGNGLDDNCDASSGFGQFDDCCYAPNCADGSVGDCCSSYNQCGGGEGDCDTDDDCIYGLKCGQGNGLDGNCDIELGFGVEDSCCYVPEG